MKKKLHWDIDGVLAPWNFGISPEFGNMHLLKEGHYFRERPVQKTPVGTVHCIYIYRSDDYEQFIDSAVLHDAPNAWQDKHEWLDRTVPEIDKTHRIFTLCGQDKISYVPGFDPRVDILIDDYGENCRTWAAKGGTYIKVSVNAEDAEYERTRHRYVIHPEMAVEEIVAVIDQASVDMDEAFRSPHTGDEEQEYDIEYRETYSDIYRVRGLTYELACEHLREMISEGQLEGPTECVNTEYKEVSRHD